MKKRFTLVAATLCLLLPAVSKAQLTPVQFNDKLVAITEELYQKGGMWGKAFNESYRQKDFTLLVEPRRQLQAFVEQKLRDVEAMKDVANSKDLREAMLAFLRYERTMITQAFMPVEKLGGNPDQEAVAAAQKALQDYAVQETAALDKVNTTQYAYAAANGFRIETTEEAGE